MENITQRSFSTPSPMPIMGNCDFNVQWPVVDVESKLNQIIEGLKFIGKDEVTLELLVEFKEICQVHGIKTTEDLYNWKMTLVGEPKIKEKPNEEQGT